MNCNIEENFIWDIKAIARYQQLWYRRKGKPVYG